MMTRTTTATAAPFDELLRLRRRRTLPRAAADDDDDGGDELDDAEEQSRHEATRELELAIAEARAQGRDAAGETSATLRLQGEVARLSRDVAEISAEVAAQRDAQAIAVAQHAAKIEADVMLSVQ
jgi:hypothetical protein